MHVLGELLHAQRRIVEPLRNQFIELVRCDDTSCVRDAELSVNARCALFCALALAAFTVAADETATVTAKASGGSFVLDPQTIDGGGGRSSGGTFVVNGTIGQPDADPLQPSIGGTFAVTGGFWAGVVASPPPGDAIFSNGLEGT